VSHVFVPETAARQVVESPRKMQGFLRPLSDPAVAGSVSVITGVVCLAIFAPWIAPYDPLAQDVTASLRAPFSAGGEGRHLLGTDYLGRDVLSRLIFGARISVFIAVVVVGVAGVIGVTAGLAAGYFRGRLDEALMKLCDIQLSFPFMLLAVTAVGVSGAGLGNMIVVLVTVSWVGYARVARAQVLSAREQVFVEAARALGASGWRTMLRHILPNILGPLWVLATLEVGQMIIAEASLSFLGLGVQPPTPSWGTMLADGRDYIYGAWWLTVIPGLAILLLVIAINALGDWLVTRTSGRQSHATSY
jgi:peptide/nickel transport system permease protein